MSIELETPVEMLERWQGIECTCDPDVGHMCEVCHDIQVVKGLMAENQRLRSIIDTLTAKAPATASLAVFLCSRCRESVDTIYEVGSGAKVEHVCVKCVDAGGDDDE